MKVGIVCFVQNEEGAGIKIKYEYAQNVCVCGN